MPPGPWPYWCSARHTVGVFFVAVVPQFLPDGHSALSMTLTLGVIDAVIAALWLTLVALFAARTPTWPCRPRVHTALERIAAGVLVALGTGTAVETVQGVSPGARVRRPVPAVPSRPSRSTPGRMSSRATAGRAAPALDDPLRQRLPGDDGEKPARAQSRVGTAPAPPGSWACHGRRPLPRAT
ncbi:hypothetical protein [Streptomyces sp. NPDC050856]|uniref:LysE family translocator n=1 Tax=Streptomyces sp. NPDC050856 TaxID=3154939 RepID=UPI0033D471C6